MIISVFLGSVQLDTVDRALSSIRNLSFPFIQYSAIRKAGFAGQSISPSNFASYKFSLEFTIVGGTFADLATKRQQFVADLAQIITQGEQTLKINKSDGVNVQVAIKGIDIDADLDARDPVTSRFRIEMEAEYPFLQSQILKAFPANVFIGGGMSIPMGIPMDMSIGGQNEITIDNDGNADAFPIFEFTGPLTTPSLTNTTTDKVFNLSASLASASDKIVVDTFLRTVVILPANSNGRRFASGDFWTVAPGNNLIRLGGSPTTGFVTITFRDHYFGI